MIAPPPDSIEHLAEWYAENADAWAALKAQMATAERRLHEYCKDRGPIQTPHGLVGIVPKGFQYDEEQIAEQFPALVSRISLAIEGEPDDVLRAYSLVQEECPKAEIKLSTAVDKAAVKAQMRIEGPATELLKTMVRPLGRLGLAKVK